MGYSVITILIKRKDNNMSNEPKTDSDYILKALNIGATNAEGLNKLAGFLHNTQEQLNLLATKVLELEKKLEVYEQRNNN